MNSLLNSEEKEEVNAGLQEQGTVLSSDNAPFEIMKELSTVSIPSFSLPSLDDQQEEKFISPCFQLLQEVRKNISSTRAVYPEGLLYEDYATTVSFSTKNHLLYTTQKESNHFFSTCSTTSIACSPIPSLLTSTPLEAFLPQLVKKVRLLHPCQFQPHQLAFSSHWTEEETQFFLNQFIQLLKENQSEQNDFEYFVDLLQLIDQVHQCSIQSYRLL